MTVQEVREIREKKSVEWANLSLEQLNTEVKKGAKQAQMKIEEIRKSGGQQSWAGGRPVSQRHAWPS
ncbi:MAG: hypothetical protein LBL83_05210 [Clostridiales bacterium]|jgi:hypothetical protein|nr:hypothetical protein [Clostridiales bacterium]